MALGLNKAKIGRRIGVYAAVCSLLGFFDVFLPLSLGLGALQSKIAAKPVSGDIVVVGIDSDSIRSIGRWPWPRDKQAELLKAIDDASPESVFVDIGYQGVTDKSADEKLRRTLETMKSPVSVAALAKKSLNGDVTTIFSHRKAVGNVAPSSVYFPYRFGFVWSLPYNLETSRGPIRSLSASIAGISNQKTDNFRIDLGYNPGSITVLSATDVINGTARSILAGKKVVVGMVDPTQNDIHSMPGWGERPGVLFHILGAESLKDGTPTSIGFFWFLAAAALFCLMLLTATALRHSTWILLVGSGVIFTASTLFTKINVENDLFPALVMLACTGIFVERQKTALLRSQRNSDTGYSDMAGYFIDEVVSNALVIGASIRIASTKRGLLQNETSPVVMKEVGHRLSAIIDERQITHNLNGQFLWESPPMPTHLLGDHLEGLKQLFAQPLSIDGRNVDVDIFFGVDRDVNTGIATRTKRALDVSIEAMNDHSTFKIATTPAFEDRLRNNFREEFEVAAENGDISTVFQAQKNLATNVIDSAEVCLNWTHPAHGQIPTTLIVDMASKSGNLEMISLLLCKKALEHSNTLEEQGARYRLSAKISAMALRADKFHMQLLQMAESENYRASAITLQIVDPEVAAADPRILFRIGLLKSAGFSIAIGNFGQTNDDIDLLKAIRPDEIVLARSFSSELFGSTSNRIYVDAALRIAKAHNITTTAEDVEDRDILNELKKRGCDRAQGKIVDIPLTFNAFLAAYPRKIVYKAG